MSNLSVVLSALAHLPSVTEAHGFMGKPISRHIRHWGSKEYTPHEGLWSGGDTSCGDWKQAGPELDHIPEGTFTLELYFTTNHGGNHHLNFKCSDPPGEWEWLTRASGESNGYNSDYPYEFFVPTTGQPKTTYTKEGTSRSMPATVATSRWNSPRKCNQGVLRWSWETSNTCISNLIHTRGGQPQITAAEYKKLVPTGTTVCGSSRAMERYINCADVRVGGGQPGRPTQEPAKPQMPPISQYPEKPIAESPMPPMAPTPTDSYPAQPGTQDSNPSCIGWKNSCHSAGVKESCPITCGQSGGPAQEPAKPTMPPISQYPEIPMPPMAPTPTGYPAQPGNDSDFVACSNWGISSCRSGGVEELCPSMCGGGRRLEFDAVYDETDTDELVSLNPSIGRMRGSSYSLPGLDH